MPGGVLLRPLAAEEDLARELLALLTADQLSRAIISPVPPMDTVQTNRPRVVNGAIPGAVGGGPGGEALRAQLGLTDELDDKLRYSLQPKGLLGNEIDAAQRDVLICLVRAYMDHIAEPLAAQYAAVLIPSVVDHTGFAWAGLLERGAPHYYRIQSEQLLIEYDCVQSGANHTHSVGRDPVGDFGESIPRRNS
jgi:hypothetical protein